MEPICDLHTHSTYSDGTLSPEGLIYLAQERGISAVALCDHNTVAGLPAFLEAAAGSGRKG
jgi:predicted metal-dependent phosphoesterase TrpH